MIPNREQSLSSYPSRGSHSTGCRTLAWAKPQATAGPAWAGMAAAAGCKRMVCGAAPQDDGDLQVGEPPGGVPLLGLQQTLGLDLEGPNRKNVAS